MAENQENKEVKQKEKNQKVEKELTLSQRRTRHGIFTTTSVIIVIAVVIALNMFLSSKEWSYDCTTTKIYTLSDATLKIVENLTEDQKITIYFLNKESAAVSVYKNVLTQYEKASKNISVEYKDLELYPNFAKDYLDEGQSAEENDMIVVCGDRYRYISGSDYTSSSYDSDGNGVVSINLEPKVTAAINYCIAEDTPVIYTLEGQGEQSLGSNLQEALEQDNYDVESLDIVTAGGIPTDCKLLVINAASTDLGKNVIADIEEYMDNDGKLLVVLEPSKMYDNLNDFLARYGVKVEEGILLETGSGYYAGQYPTNLLPTLASHDITNPLSSSRMKILAPVSKGLSVISDVTDYTVTSLLVTSSESYSKVDTESGDISQTEEDVAGPLAVAQLVETKDGEGTMVVCGSSSMGVDDVDDTVSNANTNFYCNAINYLTNEDSKISIKAPSITNSYAVFTAFASKMVMAIGIVGIPLLLVVLGIVVILVRRRS